MVTISLYVSVDLHLNGLTAFVWGVIFSRDAGIGFGL